MSDSTTIHPRETTLDRVSRIGEIRLDGVKRFADRIGENLQEIQELKRRLLEILRCKEDDLAGKEIKLNFGKGILSCKIKEINKNGVVSLQYLDGRGFKKTYHLRKILDCLVV